MHSVHCKLQTLLLSVNIVSCLILWSSLFYNLNDIDVRFTCRHTLVLCYWCFRSQFVYIFFLHQNTVEYKHNVCVCMWAFVHYIKTGLCDYDDFLPKFWFFFSFFALLLLLTQSQEHWMIYTHRFMWLLESRLSFMLNWNNHFIVQKKIAVHMSLRIVFEFKYIQSIKSGTT